MSRSTFFRRLEWQPVEHACGHFEARLTVHYDEPVHAGNPCTQCAAQGRPLQPSYASRGAALDYCQERNLREAR